MIIQFIILTLTILIVDYYIFVPIKSKNILKSKSLRRILIKKITSQTWNTVRSPVVLIDIYSVDSIRIVRPIEPIEEIRSQNSRCFMPILLIVYSNNTPDLLNNVPFVIDFSWCFTRYLQSILSSVIIITRLNFRIPDFDTVRDCMFLLVKVINLILF